jgi:hypothetical protein
LNGDPVVGAKLLGDELGREFCAEEAEEEDRLAIIVLVGVQSQIIQHVIGQCLADVAAVELEGEEHEADETANSPVELGDS